MTPTGRTRGPNTRGTWSRMYSRDLLFPRRLVRRARSPRGSKRERGFESGDIGRRRVQVSGGNRSVRWTTVDSIRGRTPPPSPTASRRSYGSGPIVGAARVRRFGSCGGVSSSPQETFQPLRRRRRNRGSTRRAPRGRCLRGQTTGSRGRRCRRAAGSIARSRRRARVATWRRRITRYARPTS